MLTWDARTSNIVVNRRDEVQTMKGSSGEYRWPPSTADRMTKDREAEAARSRSYPT